MGKPSKQILDFMEKHGVESDEIWEVHGSTWVIKHKALERIAAERGVEWDRPAIIEHDAANKIAVVCVFGKLGDRTEWSIGEAAPQNNKNAYCYAMAEKRGKDRVILKLLNAHGSLYSEDEADDFKEPAKRENPHVTRPSDIMPETEYDKYGQPVDNIPLADQVVASLPKKNSKPIFEDLQKEIWETVTPAALTSWGERNKNRVASLPHDWQEILRGVYREHMDALRNQDEQDNRRLAS
ncbi:MAG: hypothetical protein EKK40_07160 [Bradyrhizobiaceae bacterium]|nr:MAG: hypothetical protein EKK40_07160 [Bradyrhizobiaceae bacterium]